MAVTQVKEFFFKELNQILTFTFFSNIFFSNFYSFREYVPMLKLSHPVKSCHILFLVVTSLVTSCHIMLHSCQSLSHPVTCCHILCHTCYKSHLSHLCHILVTSCHILSQGITSLSHLVTSINLPNFTFLGNMFPRWKPWMNESMKNLGVTQVERMSFFKNEKNS